MGIFSRLFGSKLTVSQTEAMLGEIEQLSKLRSVFPAMVRLQILGEKASRKIIGPSGPLHDRFYRAGLELCRTVGSIPDEMVRITPAWDALPNVVRASMSFHGGSLSPTSDELIRALADRKKEFVVFANANPNVREQNPQRQMRAFFDLVDHPTWMLVLLIFSGSPVVRAAVIREHPSAVSSARTEELFPKLCSAAQNEGAIKVLR